MSSSRRSDQSQDLRPESPLSDRSPRLRDTNSKKKSISSSLARLSPKTPLPLPNSAKQPKHPRRYSTEKVTDFRLEEVHRPTDRVVHVDLEEIENDIRGGTPSHSLSIPSDRSLLDESLISTGPKTSTPKKSSRRSRRASESLYKKVLLRSASRTTAQRPPVLDVSSMDSYQTAPESQDSLSMSGIRIETDGYRSANSTQRALFSQQGAAPLDRRFSRSASRSRRAPAPSSTLCQLVTPLAVHTSQEVNAVSVTGQILVISQTLVRSAHASSDVRKLMNRLAGKQPLISNEMSQVDIDHDNEHSKHEVFVGSDAILIQRTSTIHRGRDRNSFETDDRRTYRFVCQGDLLPEDRRDKQSKPRHLTIIAESATVKDCEEIEKSERVMLVFDAAEKPTRVVGPMPPETSLEHANFDLTSKPSALKDSPVSFEEHVRVSQNSHISIARKAHVSSCDRLWDEPLTELKEQRVYRQQLVDDANCEPVRITRSHSLSRSVPSRDRSLSASRRPATPSHVERGRTPGRASRNGSILRPLDDSPLSANRRPLSQSPTDYTPNLLTCISPIQDEPARREKPRLALDMDNTAQNSVSLPSRNTESDYQRGSPLNKHQETMRFPPSTPSPVVALLRAPRDEITTSTGLIRTARSRPVSRSPIKKLDHVKPVARVPSPYPHNISVPHPFTPLHTARVHSPQHTPVRPTVMIDEDTSAGSSQSPTQNRTPTTLSPRRARLTTAVYQSPATHSSHIKREPSSDPSIREWESMLDATQPQRSPMARRIPELLGTGPAKKPFRSLRQPFPYVPPAPARPLGSARSCVDLNSAGHVPQQSVQQRRPLTNYPLRRAISEHSVRACGAPAAPANSAIAIAPPFRRQQYVSQQQPAAAAVAQAAAAPAAPVPRIPRTTRPRASSAGGPSPNTVAISATGSATRDPNNRQFAREFTLPHKVDAKPSTSTSPPATKNVEVVENPDDYAEGEVLKKRLTLEAKINGHLWNLSVTFALKADRADLIRFAPKRVRIDDQTLWEETENWSQTSLTPVTGPRTVARGSASYDQMHLPASGPVTMPIQTTIQIAPKTTYTASTASSASPSGHSTEKKKKSSSKKSSTNNSKSGEKKKHNGTPFV